MMNELSFIDETISGRAISATQRPTHWVAIAVGVCLIGLMRQTVFAVALTPDVAATNHVGSAEVQEFGVPGVLA